MSDVDHTFYAKHNRLEIAEVEASALDVEQAYGFRGTLRKERRMDPFGERQAQHSRSVIFNLRLQIGDHACTRFQWRSRKNHRRRSVIP